MIKQNNQEELSGQRSEFFALSMLAVAVYDGDLNTVKNILSVAPQDANVITAGAGLTPFQLAISRGSLSLVKAFVESGVVDVESVDARGRSCQELAILSGHPGVKQVIFVARAEKLGLAP